MLIPIILFIATVIQNLVLIQFTIMVIPIIRQVRIQFLNQLWLHQIHHSNLIQDLYQVLFQILSHLLLILFIIGIQVQDLLRILNLLFVAVID